MVDMSTSSGAAPSNPFGASSTGAGSVMDFGAGPPNQSTVSHEPVAGKAVQACMGSVPPKVETIRIRVSLFFDGTLNNRTNVGLGAEFNSSDSYSGSVTNVGLLERIGIAKNGPGADEHVTLYIEGIGTTDEESDSIARGASMGMGDTGVVAKALKGLDQAVSLIVAGAGNKTLDWVHFDTFGFSRGAAAARHCVWRGLKDGDGRTLKMRLTEANKPPGNVKSKFVGLFDTVASFGLLHYNDTADLQLDAIANSEKVVQLAAAEEHRANFRLTNIASAGAGEEYFLPGAHSDVGGGYNDSVDEVDCQLYRAGSLASLGPLETNRKWLADAGWFHQNELAVLPDPPTIWGTRRGISNLYSLIPLKVMGKFARNNGVYIASKLERDHAVPEENSVLASADAAIEKMIASNGGKTPSTWFKDDPSSDPAWHKALRHGYLHFSANYDGWQTNTPQFDGMRVFGGRRRRIIQPG